MSVYYCLVCGEPGHGNLPCPTLQGGLYRAPEYAPNPSPLPPGAQPLGHGDIDRKLNRIIELLEQLQKGDS